MALKKNVDESVGEESLSAQKAKQLFKKESRPKKEKKNFNYIFY
jgi:hypothetical protein